MADCLKRTVRNRHCVFEDDLEVFLTCEETEGGRCDGDLNLSRFLLVSTDLSKAKTESMQLLARAKLDAQLLIILSTDLKTK